jgi:2-polyprenyl-6-methoxyphenol hydroxylase-like FAD-dependent oxidoreductase
MSNWWQERRERAQLRQAIRNFCQTDGHLLQDIGVDRLALRHGLTVGRANGSTDQELFRNARPAHGTDRGRAPTVEQLRRNGMTDTEDQFTTRMQQHLAGSGSEFGSDPRPRDITSGRLARRAVVIGAGIGGLSAAGALAPYFERVDILERDNLPVSAGSRSGTPQDRHPHGLLAGGLQALDQIFPGFKRDLAAAGAVSVAFARDVQLERPDVGVLPKRDFGIGVLAATRPLIEGVLRRRVEAITNITLRPASRVTGIVPASSGLRTRGVQFVDGSGRPQTLDAELVVDASGRGAPTLALFETLGRERPSTTEIGVDITYSTVVVEIPRDAADDWKLVLTLPDSPRIALHAVLVPIEGGRWITGIAEHGRSAWVDTWDAFLDMSRSLITPTVYNALRYARPPDGIRHYRFPASIWKHFERLPQLPPGVLPVADALCRFNPIHGQGMSSAAKQALLLRDVLSRAAAEPDPIAAAQAGFMAEVASVLETPWTMSTSADLAFPETRAERPENFAQSRRFEEALFRAAVADPVVHRAMLEVAQLLAPHQRLRDPDIMRRIEAVSALEAAA